MKSESVSPSVVSDSLRPHGLQSIKLLCPWDFLGKNTRVAISYSRGDLSDLWIEPTSASQADSLPTEPLRKPSVLFSKWQIKECELCVRR